MRYLERNVCGVPEAGYRFGAAVTRIPVFCILGSPVKGLPHIPPHMTDSGPLAAFCKNPKQLHYQVLGPPSYLEVKDDVYLYM